jgi:hypothetical protein
MSSSSRRTLIRVRGDLGLRDGRAGSRVYSSSLLADPEGLGVVIAVREGTPRSYQGDNSQPSPVAVLDVLLTGLQDEWSSPKWLMLSAGVPGARSCRVTRAGWKWWPRSTEMSWSQMTASKF